MCLRIRGESNGHHVTTVVVRGGKRQQEGPFLFPRFPNGLRFASDRSRVLLETAFQHLLVQVFKTGSGRQRHHKIAPRVPDPSTPPFSFPLATWQKCDSNR